MAQLAVPDLNVQGGNYAPAASPVGGVYATPNLVGPPESAPNTNLERLGDALMAFGPKGGVGVYTAYQEKQQKLQMEKDAVAGAAHAAAMQQAGVYNYDDAVKRGIVPLGLSEAAQETMRINHLQYFAKKKEEDRLTAYYAPENGAVRANALADPHELNKWNKEFSATWDTKYLTSGVDADGSPHREYTDLDTEKAYYREKATDGELALSRNVLHDRIVSNEAKMIDQAGQEVYQSLQDAHTNGKTPEEISVITNEKLFGPNGLVSRGLNPAKANDILGDSIINYAENTGDVTSLKLLDSTQTGSGSLGQIPRIMDKAQAASLRITAQTHASESYAREKAARVAQGIDRPDQWAAEQLRQANHAKEVQTYEDSIRAEHLKANITKSEVDILGRSATALVFAKIPSTDKRVQSILSEIGSKDPGYAAILEGHLRSHELGIMNPPIADTTRATTIFAFKDRFAKGDIPSGKELLSAVRNHQMTDNDALALQGEALTAMTTEKRFPILRSHSAQEQRNFVTANIDKLDSLVGLDAQRTLVNYDAEALAWLQSNPQATEGQFTAAMQPIAEKWAGTLNKDIEDKLKVEKKNIDAKNAADTAAADAEKLRIERATPEATLAAEQVAQLHAETHPTPEAQATRKQAMSNLFTHQKLTPEHIRTLLSKQDGNAIVSAAERTWRPGTTEKPITERDLTDIVRNKLAPLYPTRPADLAEATDEFVSALRDRFAPPKTKKAQNVISYGLREDKTAKGPGFFGELPRPTSAGGGFSTELSATGNLNDKQGNPILYPLLVPTLSRQEINTLLRNEKPTDAIYHKAEVHAAKRIKEGKSPFAQVGEPTWNLPN